MKVMVSIIVPVYNAEKTINRCLNSIVNQTYSDIEVLIIDDGSTDLTGLICDRYAERYNFIRVFHKVNEGVSVARKLGIKYFRGIYSIHVDADDYIDSQEIEMMINVALKFDADIVVCDYLLERKINDFIVKKELPVVDDSISFLKQIYEGECIGTLWNKLIRTSLYCNVDFLNNVNYCEDVYLLTQILLKNVSLRYISKPLYYYCYNAVSLTHRIDKKMINDRIEFIRIVEKIIPSYINVLRFKIGVKLYLIKSGIYDYKEYINLYSDINLKDYYAYLSKKDFIFILGAKCLFFYNIISFIFVIKNKFMYN